jgi:hypothetical protein
MLAKSHARIRPPHDRPFLALAKNAISQEMHEAIWIVAAWNSDAEEWRPVRVHGDQDPGINLEIIAWSDLSAGDEE